MRILAVDPGTQCGWAVTDGTVYDSGVFDLSSRRHEGGGYRYLRFRQYATEILDGGIDLVVYEEVASHKGTAAAHIYGGFVAVLTEECERRSIPYAGIPVGTIKKHVTGKGNASKEMMVAFAKKRWPHVTDHNEADALHMARLAADTHITE